MPNKKEVSINREGAQDEWLELVRLARRFLLKSRSVRTSPEEIRQMAFVSRINELTDREGNNIVSVVGTIEIAESDPDLSEADEYIRKAISQSLNLSITQKKTKRVMKPRTKKDQKIGRHKRASD